MKMDVIYKELAYYLTFLPFEDGFLNQGMNGMKLLINEPKIRRTPYKHTKAIKHEKI